MDIHLQPTEDLTGGQIPATKKRVAFPAGAGETGESMAHIAGSEPYSIFKTELKWTRTWLT